MSLTFTPDKLQRHKLSAMREMNGALVTHKLGEIIQDPKLFGGHRRLSAIVSGFYSNGLMPMPVTGLSDLMMRVDGIGYPEKYPDEDIRFELLKLRDYVTNKLNYIDRSTTGLCLDCIKAELTGMKDAVCRVSHE